MDEARAVLRRLRRIDALERERAHPRTILAEVDALLLEAAAWVAVEGEPEEAVAALARCRAAVQRGAEEMIPM